MEIETKTVGLNGIQETAPVFPPTQFPQLSVNAEPLTSPLQSTLKQTIVKGKDCKSTSPNSEFIVEVKLKPPARIYENIIKSYGLRITTSNIIIIRY